MFEPQLNISVWSWFYFSQGLFPFRITRSCCLSPADDDSLDGSPVHQTVKASHQHFTLWLTARTKLKAPIKLTCRFLGRMRRTTNAGKTQTCRTRLTNSTHKDPSQVLNLQLSYCEVTVLHRAARGTSGELVHH